MPATARPSASSIRAEWTSERDYEQRIQNLRDGSGPILAGSEIRLVGSGPQATALDDDAADKLKGGSGNDWYFAQLAGEDDDDRVWMKDGELLDLLDD